MYGCIAVMLVSGFLLFSTEAVKLYGNWAFQLKMIFLLLALLFTASLHRRVLDAPDTEPFVRMRDTRRLHGKVRT